MNLYEIANGWIGESYVRTYVWAHDEAEARILAAEAFESRQEGSSEDMRVTFCFSSDAQPFASVPSDSGWEPSASTGGAGTTGCV